MATAALEHDFKLKGRVARVVPGRLFYVEASDRVFAVKLNTLLIREKDGKTRRYRGEPFRALGLKVGTTVTVQNSRDETQVVLDLAEAQPKRGLSSFVF
ncbi:hypothetical protein ABIF66_000545 [Bradyrhizobium japonicum]|uniref:DUF5666 domain-containing protein n=1 Tax=Bradyrhizobium barranii subsp. barranii TaxID=2823807 RepID=A0A7Z0TQR6_9BRAD|nr:hypothetical protein [Bradyrhizobium barranii]UGX95244.1 hypothetical protein G6321_00008880 [Bradyrhizobium barranii subsp. barranii]